MFPPSLDEHVVASRLFTVVALKERTKRRLRNCLCPLKNAAAQGVGMTQVLTATNDTTDGVFQFQPTTSLRNSNSC
jgi:hypothetical protein